MKLKLNYLIILLFIGQLLTAQEKTITIKANSTSVDIRDGESFKKGTWKITPEANPDVYVTSSLGKKVTFYTDLDSISIEISKTTKFDFIILLNGKTKAFTQIKYKPTYLETLKEASKYNLTENREIPKFTYQDKENPNLVALRNGFKLDSIAGKGNEVSKIINLLHWIHNLIPHDGQHANPEVKNAMNMIAVCKKDKRGLNCRGLATVLNECYLSLGIKSRFVTCLPKDHEDTECHVINMVYSNDLKKWLWIDPTNDAYVMNEKGELLSIEEVRERLINNGPLIVNPDANWNHKESVKKENYLYNYMAKNTYRFECPLVSEYNSETWFDGKSITFVDLLPIDYDTQEPIKKEGKNKITGTTFIYFKTNNPSLFWQTPN